MLKFKILKNAVIKNKRVLVRVDFDLPLDDKGNIVDDFRLKKSVPTIEYLIKKKAKVILMAHLGRPGGKKIERFKMDVVQDKLLEHLDYSIVKAKDCIGKEVEGWTKQMQLGEILLLENLRFHKGEEENDLKFAKSLAKLADIYVNDAFAVSHREHASIVGIPKYLPAFAGFLLEKEVEELNKVLYEPKHPLAVVIGGAKITTKMKLIKKFLEKADNLLLGGALANTVLAARGVEVGKSIIEKEAFEEIRKAVFDHNLFMPIDAVVSKDLSGKSKIFTKPMERVGREEMVLDIGPGSVRLFSGVIKKAKMIIWNGPMGIVEVEAFSKGTRRVAQAISQSNAHSIVGGGDTVAFLRKTGLDKGISHLSTGGGAMLDYLANGTLPGIEALHIKNLKT